MRYFLVAGFSPLARILEKRSRRAPAASKAFGLAAVLGSLGFLATGCTHTDDHAKEQKPAEVIVTTPVMGEVTDYQDFTGRLDALKTIDIRARVSGFVTDAPFKEGQVVHEGDLLFQIDRRPFEAALNQAEANLKVGRADKNLQEKNAARARAMIASHSIAREDFDTMIASAEKA